MSGFPHTQTTSGVSSKTESATMLQDKLIGALIGLARATDGNEHLITPSSTGVILESLQSLCKPTVSTLEMLCKQVEQEKRKMVPDCFLCANPCGKNSDYDMNNLRHDPQDIQKLKALLLLGIRSMAADAGHAAALGRGDVRVDRFFYKALIAIGMEDWSVERLTPIVMELGEMSLLLHDHQSTG